MRYLIGEEGAALTQTVIDHTVSEERSQWSLALGALLTLLGASTVFGQLQYALNRVWRVKAAPRAALIMTFIKQRILSFALVLSVGFLLMVSLVISAVLGALHKYLDERLAEAAFFWSGLDLMISFALATVLIAMLFKYLPDAEIEWRDTWLGALITAALFIVGKQVIGLYLGQTTVASSFGAAASVVIFMLWVYYAAVILLFGAEITQAVAARRGAIVVPTENAKPAPPPPSAANG
jgi:membrane protein